MSIVRVGGSQLFWRIKRLSDLGISILLLPVLGIVGLALWLLNPWVNPGPLLYRQRRVGRHHRLFVMVKFRTMRPDKGQAKFADAESHRITRFAAVLRRFRIDELPQIINVLRGEMSLIGPRPEQPEFVRQYCKSLPGYHHRHIIRPGLSGLSQVVQGYTSDDQGTRTKLALDLRYIAKSGFRMEAYVFWRTLVTVLTGYGAM
ncbi:sugar transferase [Sulfitobacter sp. M57]|uniref:sugar transferase n=1 Tax=unclassified Sulfitobacter TaxID=196795 RepID=UPI0023E09C32|nr:MULTISPECIES: sugar transferase [unclassified Sulfitobacter]MDF3413827.1 sugar transferase [Sulfitobacter sp. KE5]MDF3420892.1 sugar transferase [Sulfitobacter sp. KE43]MDF3432373.1 sugar transferase [Sulfitobacter sp. KE42]MDF3458012.1 sugar transferase [Sulfitobacter sp. S74]MDF3461913.1 sugar transferase [Sulfitobacter sp. Ks18]